MNRLELPVKKKGQVETWPLKNICISEIEITSSLLAC
jgi:hypothetical protein